MSMRFGLNVFHICSTVRNEMRLPCGSPRKAAARRLFTSSSDEIPTVTIFFMAFSIVQHRSKNRSAIAQDCERHSQSRSSSHACRSEEHTSELQSLMRNTYA